jgi:hypothetical protein
MVDEAKRRRLANLRPFQPGRSGNPGGRTKAEFDVIRSAREHTQEAIDTLVLVMRNGKPAEAAMAANSLLDRAWGRPQAPPEIAGVTAEDVAQELMRLAGEEAKAAGPGLPVVIEGAANESVGRAGVLPREREPVCGDPG